MFARLVYNLGVVAITAGLTVMVAGSTFRGLTDYEYQFTIKKNADGTYYLDPKPSTPFYMEYHGQIRWNVVNASPDEITFTMTDFQKYAGDCPLDFLGNTGNTNLCVGSVRVPSGGDRPIKAKRYRSSAYSKQKFGFKTKVGDTYVDPEIEIDRDPYSVLTWITVVIGGLLSVVGWYLLRRQR